MAFAGMNYLAVLAAAVAGFMFGGLYYWALARPWIEASEWSAERRAAHAAGQMRQPMVPMITAAVANLIMAWVLAGVIAHLGPGQVTLRNGVISAAFIWLGFVVTTLAVNYGFGGRKAMLTVIDSGHWLGVLLVQGAIIGALGAPSS
jgi:hypothetical protein